MVLIDGYNDEYEEMTHARPHTFARHSKYAGDRSSRERRENRTDVTKPRLGAYELVINVVSRLAITRQMFVVGEVSYRHYTTRRHLLWPLKHFAPNTRSDSLPTPTGIMNINSLLLSRAASALLGIRQLHRPCVMRGCKNNRVREPPNRFYVCTKRFR